MWSGGVNGSDSMRRSTESKSLSDELFQFRLKECQENMDTNSS